MARQYGNKTGAYSEPTAAAGAPGSWVSTTEVVRQVSLTKWPVTLVGVPFIEAGTYVYALSSGVSDTLTAGGNFYLANGSAISRTTNSELYGLLGTTYGVGDNVSTFNLPNVSNLGYNYLKTTTTSGAALAALSGTDVLPSHTHSVYGCNSSYQGPPTNNNGPPRTLVGTSLSPTLEVGHAGSPSGNNGRHRQAKVLIAKTSVLAPVGCVFPVLLPLNTSNFESLVPPDLLIPSGQNINRLANPILFEYFGTKFGSGDGSTTFTLPDLRGLFLKSYPDSQVDSSGVLPSGYILDGFARHTHVANLRVANSNQAQQGGGPNPSAGYMTTPATGSSSVGGGSENTPANISVVWVLVKG
jgi:microcystin-dependent protein